MFDTNRWLVYNLYEVHLWTKLKFAKTANIINSIIAGAEMDFKKLTADTVWLTNV